MPGVIRIDRDQVTSGALVTGDKTVLRFEVPGKPQPLTVVRWHQRLVGEALGVDDGALALRVEIHRNRADAGDIPPHIHEVRPARPVAVEGGGRVHRLLLGQ